MRRFRVGAPVGILVLGLVFVLPVLVLVLSSVAARWIAPDILPTAWSLRGWYFIRDNGAGIITAIVSSVTYSIAVVAAAFLLSVLPATVLGRYEFRGRLLVEALLLSPVLIPAITWSMGIHFTLLRLGIANSAVGIIVVLTAASYPYMLRALISGVQQIPPDLDACAANLGAAYPRRLLTLHVPLLVPAIIAGGSVVFLIAFSEYFLVFLIGGGAVPSFTGYLFPYLAAGDRAIASALTVLFLLVPIVLFAVIDRGVQRQTRRWGVSYRNN